MGQLSYDIEKVYKEFVTISNYFDEDNVSNLINNPNAPIHNYCHYESNSGDGKCNDYFQMASSGVIHFLNNLKNTNGLDYDKLAEYAILWLSYKLNINSQSSSIKLNDFYTQYIETNNDYNKNLNDSDSMTYKAIIDKKKNLMDIKEISKFNDLFSILYYLYYVIRDEDWNCKENLELANKFYNQFKELNNDSNNIEDSSYNKLLSTLSNDYNNLKKTCDYNRCTNFPPLPKIEAKKSSAQNSVVNPVDKSVKGSEQLLGQTPEATSSSSSILNTVIPGLSIFAIPVFLGVAYKYSLFGIDKLFQRQYIRKQLKKIKKKMKLNI
ncbi:CIR protein PIR protein [Plasmodium vinckei vinckei]|uniref:CIR protein PIR protein n=1 Tax=Plasmodium vinckei vinckei TaxID=54757 RepID=A0A449BS76_PLAVN|nr:CIR protein PIR protein [Plasmodium vinckei vinckei]VEV56199.1 CIR protein PIR protein [Plasmodium vinckei vinckei]